MAGADNHADTLSLLLQDLPKNKDTMETAKSANSIASAAIPAALTAQKVEQAPAQDPTVLLVCKAIASGD